MERYDFDVDGVVAYALEKHGPACGIGLQFPEGLVAYGSALADSLQERLPNAFIVILGDVLYGACNVDDCGCSQLGLDLLVHFGHSRAVRRPLLLDVYYVPVERKDFDAQEAGRAILAGIGELGVRAGKRNDGKEGSVREITTGTTSPTTGITKLALVSTAQYCSRLAETRKYIEENSSLRVYTPHFAPLNEYELLGCTCKQLPEDVSAVVSVADGEFHLEAAAIANPTLPVYRLDPNLMALEPSAYQAAEKIEYRREAVLEAIARSRVILSRLDSQGNDADRVGIVFGTMGRQGSERLLATLRRTMKGLSLPYLVIGLSEVLPNLLFPFKVAYWIQLACPRLSFDWGEDYRKEGLLVLNAYEAFEVMRGLLSSRNEAGAEQGSGLSTVGDIEEAGSRCTHRKEVVATAQASPFTPFASGYCLHNFCLGTCEEFTYESIESTDMGK